MSAHRLRNVYKPSNIIANTLKGALFECDKLRLTATPLQNSLLAGDRKRCGGPCIAAAR
jgi:hypothetical protein